MPSNASPHSDAPQSSRRSTLRRWALHARTIDNYGDIGIIWRLARQLAREHRLDVELTVDDLDVLSRLAPGVRENERRDGVLVQTRGPASVPDVVVTGLDTDLPDALREPVRVGRSLWIGLHYLSAEPWVESFHAQPSRKHDGCVEHFWFPGFTAQTGGLLRENDLLARRDAFQSDPRMARRWLESLGACPPDDAILASLLCYREAPLDELHRRIAARGTHHWHWIVPDGATGPVDGDASQALQADRIRASGAGFVSMSRIPFVPQVDYDSLLWTCDVNVVRGEDSWIRAIWAGRPMLWQPYRQDDRLHETKLDAFLQTCAVPRSAATLMRWFNGVDGIAEGDVASALDDLLERRVGWPDDVLAASSDLAHRLVAWVSARDR